MLSRPILWLPQTLRSYLYANTRRTTTSHFWSSRSPQHIACPGGWSRVPRLSDSAHKQLTHEPHRVEPINQRQTEPEPVVCSFAHWVQLVSTPCRTFVALPSVTKRSDDCLLTVCLFRFGGLALRPDSTRALRIAGEGSVGVVIARRRW